MSNKGAAGQTEFTAQPQYRAGVAARMAGMSVETLRVWERRYELSGASRTGHGHRVYSAEQVRRLGLLKQLVDAGHPIGVLAKLSAQQLHDLLNTPSPQSGAGTPVRVAIVGSLLVRRIALTERSASFFSVVASINRLDDIASLPRDSSIEVLLVESSELDEATIPKIVAAREACGAMCAVVLYRFCASATIRALRAAGCFAARVPAEIEELVLICRSALSGERLPVPVATGVPRVRFDEEFLSLIATSGNGVVCECPRHLADLLMMVGSFERYSGQCASRNEDDAKLHKELEHAAGSARAILEVALERLARADGLWPDAGSKLARAVLS